MKKNSIVNRIFYNRKNIVFILLALFTLQSCGGGSGSGTKAPEIPDTQPDAFAFQDINNAALNSVILSDIIQIKGINAAARISIIGGEYSIDGGEFTVANGTVNNNQKVQISLTSFGTFLTSKVATLTIGGLDGLFNVKTGSQAVVTTPQPFNFVPPIVSNANLNADYFSSLVRITGINAAADISINGGGATYAITNTNGVEGTFTSAPGKVNLGEQVRVKLKSSNVVGGTSSATLTVGTETASFSVTTLIPNDSTPDPFPIAAVTNAPLASLITSDPIVVRGISIPAEISIPAGGLYSVNSGAFHRTVGETVVAGDVIQVQLTSSSTVSTPSTITLTIGGVSEIFSVTTITGIVGITVSPLTLSLTESPTNPTQDIVVRLNTPPNGDVVFNVASTIPLAATVSPARIILNSGNWNTGVAVTVTSHKDRIARGNGAQNSQTTDITFVVDINVNATTDQTGYLLETVQPVTTTVIDDDVADIVLTPPTQLGNISEGKTKTFAVKLNSEPLNAITLSVVSSLPNQASVDKSTLTFTATPSGAADNWNNTQIITVTGIKDGKVDADTPVKINLKITTGDSTTGNQVGYNSRLDKAITATIINTDAINTTTDGGAFLQFLNKSAPRNNESAAAGTAYYAAIDPNNKRSTLTTFKSFNNLNASVDSNGQPNVAVYVNDADLGFGRRMYLNVNRKTVGTVTRVTSVASCVENYAPATGVNAPAQEKINLAKASVHNVAGGLIATVCMEYSGTPGSPGTVTSSTVLTGRKFVKFFSYAADGSRITQANLDGRGLKTQPGLCNTCHGGQGNSLLASGAYPANGDTRAQFLPWDLETLVYDTSSGSTRSDLEPILKRFNEGVLATYPQPQTFSFRGNVIIPKLPPNGIDSATGKVVNPGIVETSITVSGVTDLMNSLVFSIDEDAQGLLPGISFPTVQALGFELITPSGKIFSINDGTTGIYGRNVVGTKKLYLSDNANSSRGDVNEVGSRIVNNLITGTALISNRGMINNTKCFGGLASPKTPEDIGCTNANGIWKLRISNNGYKYVDTTTNAVIDANLEGILRGWSLHFNGVPDGAYTPAPVELIRGWYGGKNLPRSTVDSLFIPPGWKAVNNPGAVANPEILYLDVIGPTCRACHIQRGTIANNDIDFSTYTKFMLFSDRTKSLVFDKGLMPLAKRTYENHFWNSTKPNILSQHMLVNVAGLQPGRNIANAGIARTVKNNLAVRLNDVVRLNGHGSLFPNAYSWTVVAPAPNLNIVSLTWPTTATPEFIADQLGTYQVELKTNGNLPATSTTRSTITIDVVSVSNAPGPILFIEQIIGDNTLNAPTTTNTKAMNSSCMGSRCHGSNFRELDRLTYVQEYPATVADQNENYRIIRDRVDTFLPLDSLTIRKGLETLRHGSIGRTANGAWHNTGAGLERDRYDLFLRWILEGATR